MEKTLATINSSLPLHRSSATESDHQKAVTIALLLSKLAVHYYRANFTEGQAKSLISDMVEDLAEFPVCEVEVAIKAYRREGASKYFPTSGALRTIILEARKERAQANRISSKPLPNDPRPIMWWCLPQRLWKPHWREEDIPLEHVRNYQLRMERKAA